MIIKIEDPGEPCEAVSGGCESITSGVLKIRENAHNKHLEWG